MTKYTFKFFGNIGVHPLEYEYEENFMDDVWALKAVKSSMLHLYPVYQTAAVWKHDEDGKTKLIGEYVARVEIVRKES